MMLRPTALSALMMLANVLGCGSVETSTTKSSTSSFAGAESSQNGGVGGHSCEEQASWGKCSESWMHPVCSYACGESSQAYYLIPNSVQPQPEQPQPEQPQPEQPQPEQPQPAQPQPEQPQDPQYAGQPQPPRYGTSTLPYPYNNNGLMIPNMNPYERWSNNTGLLYPNVGGANSFPYSNSTTDGVMGTGTGLVTTNMSGGYSNSPYWNGQRTPWQ